MKFLNLSEFKTDPLLSVYGQFLAAISIFTAGYWAYLGEPSAVEQMRCFAQMPFCVEFNSIYQSWPMLAPTHLVLIAVLALFSIFAFRAERPGTACAWLVGSLMVKTIWIIRSYEYMGNFHYMPLIMTLVFVFFPHRRANCSLLLVLFYVSAGLLKFNPEWTTGAALYNIPEMNLKLLADLTLLVPTLEVSVSWLLLSSNAWWRRIALASFFVFHAFSWLIVGALYPGVMFLLLSLFFLPEIKKSWRLPNAPLPKASLILGSLFLLLQFTPYIFAIDPALTGLPRTFSLNMFDAKTECVARIEVVKGRETRHVPRDFLEATRIHCDPIVLFSQVRRICALDSEVEVNLELWSRRQTSLDFTLATQVGRACSLGRAFYWKELF